ncbi:MAG: ABC transporter substrate-binding protein, partial [Nitrospirae bacterium]|nr:ABC transporter substrate-binding protein [Nitrospirota bacterium]
MTRARRITSVVLGISTIYALSVLAGLGPAALAAEKPVIVGASISLNGAYARTGEYQKRGYEMWVEDANARGGLLGRKVEIKYYDDKSDPNEAAKLYERLIT